MQIAAWLRGLGLEQYEPAFRARAIDATTLRSLTAADLKDLGVAAVGHRRRLLHAIAALAPGQPETASATPFVDTAMRGEAERRQLTVMFCDLVGSTALAARLDPEDTGEVIGAYQEAVARCVARFDGVVAKYMGDGVLAYFGYPQAHEDDAERAVHTGLAVVEAVGRLEVMSVRPQVRVGIATGLVVVGDVIGKGSSQEQVAVGEAPNLASRLQSLASPNEVVIAAATRRLVGDLFEYRDLGAVAMKGLDGLVQASRVLRANAAASRFEALRGATVGRLVGRDHEIGILLQHWARARTGNGQVVLVAGEAGLGKSHIAATLAERLGGEPHHRLRFFCSPYYQDSALYPFIEQLARVSGFARDDTPATRLAKLEGVLAPVSQPEDVAFLGDLLSLPPAERHPLPAVSPQRKKERIMEALLRQVERLSRQQPVVAIFEDAHWIDPTSRELLDLAIDRVRSLPVLLIVTFRPDFKPPWAGSSHVDMLTLDRLDRNERVTLVSQIAGGKALPPEVVEQIVDRGDGVPLFIEELTKNVLEGGLLREEADRYVLEGALPTSAVPTRLHDSLMARLDRLASVRVVAQIGAAIGREFSYALLRAVCRLEEHELQAALDRFVASELLFRRGKLPDTIYTFKHALVQDAAHGSLLRSTRQHLHAEIAQALEALSPELVDSQPDLFAQHYAEAGRVEKSVAFWSKAGRRSAARSEMAEAAKQLQKGLDQLALLPHSHERLRQQLNLQSVLGAVLASLKGYAARETGDAFVRSRQLWEQLGSPSEFLPVPFGQVRYHVHRGELGLARRLDEDLLRLSSQRNDSKGLVLSHFSSGRTLMFMGEFARARSHLEAAVELYDPLLHGTMNDEAGFHHRTNSAAFLALTLFCLGYPDQALALNKATIAEAEESANPHTLAASLLLGAVILLLSGDDGALGERTDQLAALADEQSFPLYRAQGAIYRGWLMARNGAAAKGTSLLRDGLAGYRATGAGVWVGHYMALLAGACEAAGLLDESASLLDEALGRVEESGERWFAAELNRLRGRLLLRQGHVQAAEDFFLKALSVARDQQARFWELRTGVSLAQLRRDDGRPAEAHALLKPIYSQFSEGFGTTDLKQARVLIEELERAVAMPT